MKNIKNIIIIIKAAQPLNKGPATAWENSPHPAWHRGRCVGLGIV